MGAKYNFTISGNSLLMQRTPISEDTQYKAISFKSPSLVQDNNKIKLFEAGEFQTSLRFIDFGLIDGIEPTDLQDAKDKLLALIGTISEGGGGNFVPLPGTTVGNPITGDLEFAGSDAGFDVVKIFQKQDTDEAYILFDSDGYNFWLGRKNILSGEGSLLIIGQSDITAQVIDSFTISSNESNCRGLIGGSDFTPNITDLDYTQKRYVDERGSVLNTTTAVLSASDLNTLYPNAKDGFSVICPNVMGGGKYYIKAGAGWVYQQILTVV